MKKQEVLFHDRALSSVYIAVGLCCFAFGLFVMFLATGYARNDAWLFASTSFLLGIGFFVYSRFTLTITSSSLSIRQGFHMTEYTFTQIEEVLCIPTPIFSGGGRHSLGGAVSISLPRTTSNVATKAAWESIAPSPWYKAKQSVLILNRGSRSNYILPHQKAEEIVQMIRTRLQT